MKKWLIGFLIFFILLSAATYIFIPGDLFISKITLIHANQNLAYRLVSDENNWDKWWPADDPGIVADNKNVHNYHGYNYFITGKMINGIVIAIRKGDAESSSINIIPLASDSVALEWKCTLVTGLNPIQKIVTYIEARKIRDNMAGILNSLQLFLKNPENVYGISIEEKKVIDTLLVATKALTDVYPTPTVYYNLVENLKDYIGKHGAKETGYPMLHVRTIDANHFEVMVAVPVNKVLEGNNNIFFKRMVAGNILETEVKGGFYKVNEAYNQLENYVVDYNRTSPAIPFQSLVTDRLKETDTTKWITRIYYPVF